MRFSTICVFILLIICFATTINALNFSIKVSSQSDFDRIAATETCATTSQLTKIYVLPKQNAHYYSAAAGFLNSQCRTDLLAITRGTGSRAATEIKQLDADDTCGTKCGATTCLCEESMTCTQSTPVAPANTCVRNYRCNSENTCIAEVGTITKINYRFEYIDDKTQRELYRTQMRDAINKWGIDAHCWTHPFVYDVQMNKQGTEYQIFILNNTISKGGCNTEQFTLPEKYFPKGLKADDIEVEMKSTTDISLSCLDINDQLLCGEACQSPCPTHSLCTKNNDCAPYAKCQPTRDLDGKDTGESRCNNSIYIQLSLMIVTIIATVTLFF